MKTIFVTVLFAGVVGIGSTFAQTGGKGGTKTREAKTESGMDEVSRHNSRERKEDHVGPGPAQQGRGKTYAHEHRKHGPGTKPHKGKSHGHGGKAKPAGSKK